jgi:hypothetical protein
MYVFIKMTRLAGYRAAAATPAAAGPPPAPLAQPGGIPVYEQHYEEL